MAQPRVAGGGTGRGLSGRVGPMLALLSFLLVSLGAVPVRAATPGVTVINVPPEFSAIDMASSDGLHFINVVVSDYNSWADIFTVDVQIFDEFQFQVAHTRFQQYPDNRTVQAQPRFDELLGQFLVRSLSTAAYNPQPSTIAEKSEMHLTFVLSPVRGKVVRVTASDLAGLYAVASVEYLTGVIGGPPPISPTLVGLVALTGAAVVVTRRVRRDSVVR